MTASEPSMRLTGKHSDASHALDRAIALTALDDCRWRASASGDYWNRVGSFGGMTAAILLNAPLNARERLGDPIALTVNYAAPMAQTDFDVVSTLSRSSRTTQHWSMELRQDDKTIATALAVFGIRRESWEQVEVSMSAELPTAESLPPLGRAIPMPWFAQYDLRAIRTLGSLDEPQVSTHAWIRDTPPRALDYPALTAICDTVMPWMFRRRKLFVPISTVSLSVYFHVGTAELARVGSEHVYTKSFGQVCHGGFMDSNAQVWSRDRQLLATTQQMMWVKE
jgi:acyl-CoA thioesterase